MRTKSIVITSVIILLITLSTIIYAILNNSSTSSNDIVLKDLNSSAEVQINFFEKPTVLLAFTSWCPSCNEDAPKIVSLYEKYKDEINIYGINMLYRDDLDEVINYVDLYNIKYPILLDETGDTHKYLGEPAFPTLMFMNAEGVIIDEIVGSTDIEIIEESFVNLIENF
ncbi:Thiol-disulfide oxidoreductase ResA [compost metagenome]